MATLPRRPAGQCGAVSTPGELFEAYAFKDVTRGSELPIDGDRKHVMMMMMVVMTMMMMMVIMIMMKMMTIQTCYSTLLHWIPKTCC